LIHAPLLLMSAADVIMLAHCPVNTLLNSFSLPPPAEISSTSTTEQVAQNYGIGDEGVSPGVEEV
jgi:hypothetical protein